MRFRPQAIVFVLLAICAAYSPPAHGEAFRPFEVWFDRIEGQQLSVSPEDLASLAAYSFSLMGGEATPTAASDRSRSTTSPTFPSTWSGDDQPRVVLLSVSDGDSAAHVSAGSGNGLKTAVDDAAARLKELLVDHPTKVVWLKLDMAYEATALRTGRMRLLFQFDRTLMGVAFDAASGIAFLPEEVQSNDLVSSKQVLEVGNMLDYVERTPARKLRFLRLAKEGSAGEWRFKTAAAFADATGAATLYRGHLANPAITPDALLDASASGAAYLARAVDANGRFVYEYAPDEDRDRSGYNMLRHAGTIMAMLQVYELTREPAILEAAGRAIAFLKANIERFGGGNDLPVLIDQGEVKLGGNALAVIALTEYDRMAGHQENLPLARQLASYMILLQDENGRFGAHKRSFSTGVISEFESEYYPGEAILALTMLFERDPDPRWIDAAASAARWLIDVRDGDLPTARMLRDHWLLYALDRLAPDPRWNRHASAICSAMLMDQVLKPLHPDWLGGFHLPPRYGAAASHLEGLINGYPRLDAFHQELQREVKSLDPNDERAESKRLRELAAYVVRDRQAIDAALEHGLRFLRQGQYGPPLAMYMRDPKRTLGGFRYSMTNDNIRIDNVQHSISAMLLGRRLSLARQEAAEAKN